MFEQNSVELDMQIYKYLYFLQCLYILQLLNLMVNDNGKITLL